MNKGKTLYVGLDIDLRSFTAQYIDINSDRYSRKKNRFSNNPGGVEKLIAEIMQVVVENQFASIAIGYEATSNYAFHLPFYLQKHGAFKEYDLKIYQINPRSIKNFKKTFADIPKTDDKDAYVIAERLKVGKLLPFSQYDAQYISLRILTRKRFSMIQQMVQEKSRFIANVFIKASGFSQDKIFADTFGAASAALLTDPDATEDLAEKNIDELVQFLVNKGKNHFSDPVEIAKTIKYVAAESYRPNKVIHDSVTHALMISYQYILFLKQQIKAIDRRIEMAIEAFRNQYAIITSLKGIGPVMAAGIIAELGDITRFSSQDKIAKYAGLVWRIKQSGKFVSEETSLTKSGNKYLRYYLIQSAQSLINHNLDFRPYYQKKFDESKKHKHKRAVVFTARKLIRVLYSLLKNNKLYESPAHCR